MKYKVLCAKTKENSYWKGQYIPVNGKPHKDEELGVDWEHYHVDWRFIPEKDRVKYAGDHGHFNNTDYYYIVIRKEDVEFLEWRTSEHKTSFEPAQYFAHWIIRLEKEYTGKRCKGKKCPHKGADLSDCIPNSNREITCPYHGLLINSDTMVVTGSFTKEFEGMKLFHQNNIG